MIVNGKYSTGVFAGRRLRRVAHAGQRSRRAARRQRRQRAAFARRTVANDAQRLRLSTPGSRAIRIARRGSHPDRVHLARPARADAAEEKQVESFPSIDVPTRDEMREIEASNRLYEEDGALYMTATGRTKLIPDPPRARRSRSSSRVPSWSPTVSVIRARSGATSPTPNAIRIPGTPPLRYPPGSRAVVNRVADVIERVATDLDAASAECSAPRAVSVARCGLPPGTRAPGSERRAHLQGARESRQPRPPAHLRAAEHRGGPRPTTSAARIRPARDVLAMSDHASFLGTKVSFILDATLGLINIDQNNILKIFSVVTVFLLPPRSLGRSSA